MFVALLWHGFPDTPNANFPKTIWDLGTLGAASVCH